MTSCFTPYFWQLLGNNCKTFSRCYAYRQDDENENYENTDDYIMECPRFANQGCFKAKYRVGELTNAYNTSYSKGCSMYDLGDLEEICNEDPNLGELCRCK